MNGLTSSSSGNVSSRTFSVASTPTSYTDSRIDFPNRENITKAESVDEVPGMKSHDSRANAKLFTRDVSDAVVGRVYRTFKSPSMTVKSPCGDTESREEFGSSSGYMWDTSWDSYNQD